MRRADGRWWVRGAGCAYRPWWILRLVRGCKYGDVHHRLPECLLGAARARACSRRRLRSPFFFSQIPASVGCPDLVRVVSACCLFFFFLLLLHMECEWAPKKQE